MSAVLPTDKTLVNRAGVDHSAPADMSTVQDTDLLLINRAGVDYKCTYLDWKNSQSKAPDVGAVTLADVAGGSRFTSTAFPVSATMTEDGLPVSTKKLKAYVEGTLKSAAQSSAITSIGPQPPTYLISRSLRFDGTASLTRASYAGTGTIALWYKSDLPNTAQTIMAGLPQVTPGNSDWNFILATGVTPAAIGSGFKGYLADVQFVDAQTLADSDFRNPDGTPKAYAGTYGTNGFHLPFSDNSTDAALGTDTSGNGNTWTVNNLSVAAGAGNDSLVDSPTNYGTDTGAGGEVRGNYATWGATYAGAAGLSNGNLDFLAPATQNAFGSISFTTGKWYWEITNSGAGLSYIGIMDSTITSAIDTAWGSQARAYVSGGSKFDGTSTSYGASYAAGDVIGFALDLDSNTLTFYKNGTSQGVAFSSGLIGKEWKPFVYGSPGSGCSVNFGQRPFAYTAPSGFKPVVKGPDMVLTLADNTGLASFALNDAVTEVGNGDDGTGTVKSVNAAGNTLTLNGLPTGWDVGSAVKGPLKASGGNVKLYCKLDAAGAVSDLQSADPGFTAWTPAGTGPYTGTVTFPATLPTGSPPDTDLPAGTTITVEVEASNTAGTDSATSNTVAPA
jgi:hypothetical protein